MTNILSAIAQCLGFAEIANIINNPLPDILNYYQKVSNNQINAVGDAVE